MRIEVYRIVGRRERFTGSLANVNDFLYTDTTTDSTIADAAPTQTLSADEFFSNPHFSLYCFDEKNLHAIFVELPPDLDLTQVPFVYQAQYEQARRVITVPMSIFNRLAAHLPPVPQPIFLYMSARSGSTLLSRAFNTSGVVTSLSEPDAITQLVHFRNGCTKAGTALTIPDVALQTVADSTMRFLFRPQSGNIGGTLGMAQAVKPRSEGVRMMDLFQTAFPNAKNLFLYRDALGWVNSFHRIFTKLHSGSRLTVDEWQTIYEGFLHTDLSHLRAYIPPQRSHLSLAEQLILWWIAIMEWYLDQWQQSMPVLAVRYDILNRYRATALEAIFGYCGLPSNASQSALDAFAEDAQAGTSVARDISHRGAELTLDACSIDEIVAILQRHPELRHPNYWAPGTLDVQLYLKTRQTLLTAEREPVQKVHTL